MIVSQFGQSPLLQDIQTKIKNRWAKSKPNPLLLYAISQVHQRLENPTKDPDMLNNFIKLREADPDKLSLDEISGAVYINLYVHSYLGGSNGRELIFLKEWLAMTFSL